MKPDPDKPWCKNCRDHTPNEEKQIAGYDSQGMSSSSTVYKCLKCDGIEMFIPSRRVPWGCVFGCFPILLSPIVLLALWMGDWTPVIVMSIPMLFMAALPLLFGSKKLKRNYAIWEEWAKENGYNENDDTGASSEDG